MQLIDVCGLIIDCEHKTAPTEESGYPSIRTPNIGRGYLQLANVNRVSEETYRLWTKRAVPQPGDLIMAREAPVGNVAMIPEGLSPCLGQRTLLIRPDTTKIDSRYLTYLLLGDEVQGTIHAMTNGVTVPHLNMEDVRSLELPELPVLPVQRSVAGVLSAYDDLVENNRRRIRILEEMARALYREWFVDLHFPGHEAVPRIASPLGPIPKGWEVKPLLDVATVTYGFPFDSRQFNADGSGTPVVRIRDIPPGGTETWTNQSVESKYHIKSGDILVGMDGNFHMNIWSAGHAYQNQRVARFASRGEIGNYHLFLALEKPIQFFNKTIVGTTVAHLGDAHVKTIRIIWPPRELRARAREVLEPMAEQVINLQRQNVNLCQTRDLLLPRLLSGQLGVGAEAA